MTTTVHGASAGASSAEAATSRPPVERRASLPAGFRVGGLAAGMMQDFMPAIEFSDEDLRMLQDQFRRYDTQRAISRSLQIPIDLLLKSYSGTMLMLTSEGAPRTQVSALEAVGIKVLFAGTGPRLSGNSIIKALVQQGYTAIYSVAGPKVFPLQQGIWK